MTGIDWGNDSKFLVSTSHDQTSRIYTSWQNDTVNERTWHEVSRAQIHGYDINAIKFLSIQHKKGSAEDDRNLCHLLVCGADEKILRLLEPPAPFVNTVNSFTDSKLRLFFPQAEDEAPLLEDKSKFIYKTKTEGGYSVLGLMVKATQVDKISCFFHEDEEEDLGEATDTFDLPYDYKKPPIEDYLVKHTLWPEINKMYGHGYEIVSIDTSPDGSVIASSCKSQTADHSAVFLWNPQTCQMTQKLEAHNYTVLQVRFSRSGKYLATVSRDRQAAVWRRNDAGVFESIFKQTVHAKLIYSVAISADDKLVVTGSRDKTFKIWRLEDTSLTEIGTVKLNDGVKSLEFAAAESNGGHLLWVGLENGQMKVFKVAFGGDAKEVLALTGHWNHSGSVNAIRYGYKIDGKDSHVVASCGDDHTVRLYEYNIEQ